MPTTTRLSRTAATLRGLLAIVLAFFVLKFATKPLLSHIVGPLSPAEIKLFEHSHVIQPRLLVGADVRAFVDALLAASLLLLTERGRWTAARLVERTNLPRSPAAVAQGLAGLAVGVAAMALIIGTLLVLGSAHATHVARPVGDVIHSLVLWSGVFALVGVTEELVNRGYPLRSLTEGIGFWGAACATSLWFAGLHYHEGDPWFGALSTGLFGLFSALTWRATGSLAFAIGFHASWDYTQSVIFGVPDSSFTMSGSLLTTRLHGPVWLTGGTVGPEGSVLAYAVVIVLIVLVARSPSRIGRAPA